MPKEKTRAARQPERARVQTFDLDDLDPYDAVRLNGSTYRLRTPTSLSLIDRAALNRSMVRMGRIERKTRPTKADHREYRALSVEVCRLALPEVSVDELRALDDEKLERIIVTFFGRAATSSGLVRTLVQMTAANRSGSTSSSAGSSRSTAATR